MEEAIKKAIEGGWKYKEIGFYFPVEVNKEKVELFKSSTRKETSQHEIFAYHCGFGQGHRESLFLLDPLFWEALGKQQGWNDYSYNEIEYELMENIPRWKNIWLRFIIHISKKGNNNVDEFFNKILK